MPYFLVPFIMDAFYDQKRNENVDTQFKNNQTALETKIFALNHLSKFDLHWSI